MRSSDDKPPSLLEVVNDVLRGMSQFDASQLDRVAVWESALRATIAPLNAADAIPKEVKAKAVAYVGMEYCMSSDDNIETDADGDSPDSEFSAEPNGVWVKAWLWCPFNTAWEDPSHG